MANAAVVYYSFLGHTETAAKTIGEQLGIPVYALREKNPHRGAIGMIRGFFESLVGAGSALLPFDADLSGYDTLFLGTPIWTLSAAPAMNAYIKDAELSGKTVILFVTVGSTTPKKVVRSLAARIKARGGKVIRAFGIRTAFVKKETIIHEAQKIAEALP